MLEHEHSHGMTLGGIAQRIQTGALKVWLYKNFDAILLTSIYTQVNGRRVLSIAWAAGDGILEHSQLIVDRLEEYADAHDCFAIEIMGRPGWVRYMRRHGFESCYAGVMKEL